HAVQSDMFSVDQPMKLKVDLNPQDTFCRTPLQLAIAFGHIQAVKVLVEQGADPSIVDGYGKSALDWASINQAMLHQMGKWSSNYVPTSDTVRVESLWRSVRQLS